MPDIEELVNRVFAAHHVKEENGELFSNCNNYPLKFNYPNSASRDYIPRTNTGVLALLASCRSRFNKFASVAGR